MGNKQFCDICWQEINCSRESSWCGPPGHFYSQRKTLDLCDRCARAIEQAAKELRMKYLLLEDNKTMAGLKGQKSLGDFREDDFY